MPDIVTDEMLEKFVPRATYDGIADVYRERYAGLSRRVTFPMPEDPKHDAAAAQAIAILGSQGRPRKRSHKSCPF